jgi:signal transduction histidine kinase
MVLRKYGLLAALESLADRSAIPVLLDVPQARWPDELELTAYMVISEAVGNSMRHAEPSRIIVRVQGQESGLLVEIDDDGCGEAPPLDSGGLASLQDRAADAGGSVRLASSPGTGTRVVVVLPEERGRARRAS